MGQPLVDHDDVRCMSSESFTQFLATIRPPEDVRTAKLYFRSHRYPDFYYVELKVENGIYRGVLPIPDEETTRVVYYIEAVDGAFNTSRSEEFVVDVDRRCRPGPGGALFTGEPGIVVGATKTAMAALPPGFQAAGVGGFISAGGAAAAAAGGGIGAAGLAIGAAAGAAAGVGVVVSKGGEEGGATTSSPVTSISGGGGGTSTVPPTTTTTAGGATATSTAGPTTTIAGSTSTTTAPDTTTTTTSVPIVACFTWNALGDCRVRFDSCSTPVAEITSLSWRMLGPPPNLDIGSSSGFTFDFTPHDPRCAGTMSFNRPIRLTVEDAGGRTDVEQQNVDIIPGTSLRRTVAEIQVRLVGADSNGSVMILAAGVARPLTAGRAPVAIRIETEAADIEARALSHLGDGGRIVFELGPDLHVFHVELGRVESIAARRVVFLLHGDGEVVRFRVARDKRLTEER